MKLTGNFQNHTKAIRGFSISLLIFSTAVSMTISEVYAAPPDKNFGGECDNEIRNPKGLVLLDGNRCRRN